MNTAGYLIPAVFSLHADVFLGKKGDPWLLCRYGVNWNSATERLFVYELVNYSFGVDFQRSTLQVQYCLKYYNMKRITYCVTNTNINLDSGLRLRVVCFSVCTLPP